MFDKEKLLTSIIPLRTHQPAATVQHIVYAADQNYIRHIGTSMLSVLANNHFPIHFHLLVSGSENYAFDIFNQLENINPNYTVTVYHLDTDYFSTLQTTSYFTIAMYYPNVHTRHTWRYKRYCTLLGHRRSLLRRYIRTVYRQP